MTSFRRKSLNKNSSPSFKTTGLKNSVHNRVRNKITQNQKFDYHLRLPFKFAQFELKYFWAFLGFISITITLLVVLQNLTAYSSNNLTPQKPQTVRLITNFNQKTNQDQGNVIQEFQTSSTNLQKLPTKN
jgi:hypothetical protein